MYSVSGADLNALSQDLTQSKRDLATAQSELTIVKSNLETVQKELTMVSQSFQEYKRAVLSEEIGAGITALALGVVVGYFLPH